MGMSNLALKLLLYFVEVGIEEVVGVIPIGDAQFILLQSHGLVADLSKREVERISTRFEGVVTCKIENAAPQLQRQVLVLNC